MAYMVRHTEEGFALIYTIVASGVILALALASYGGIATLSRLATKERTIVQAQNISFNFRLMFKNKAQCIDGILKEPMLSELTKKIKTPSYQTAATLKIDYPVPAGHPAQVFVAPDIKFEQLTIEKVSIDNVTQPKAGSLGYLAALRIDFQPVETFNPRPVILPIYAVTNAAGTPIDCFTSAYASDGVTAEDFLCLTLKGSGYKFDPAESRCFI